MDENRCTVDQNVRKSVKLTSGWVSTSKKNYPTLTFIENTFFSHLSISREVVAIKQWNVVFHAIQSIRELLFFHAFFSTKKKCTHFRISRKVIPIKWCSVVFHANQSIGEILFFYAFFSAKKNAHNWNYFAMHDMFQQISACLHPLIDAGPTVWASSISILEWSIADRRTDGRTKCGPPHPVSPSRQGFPAFSGTKRVL